MIIVSILTVMAVVSHREMDYRKRRLCLTGVVVGTIAVGLVLLINHEVFLPAVICFVCVLVALTIAIFAQVTPIGTVVIRAVVRWRRQPHHQNAMPDASFTDNSSGRAPGESSAAHSPNSQHPDMDTTTTGSAT
jgi:hypothetical protein